MAGRGGKILARAAVGWECAVGAGVRALVARARRERPARPSVQRRPGLIWRIGGVYRRPWGSRQQRRQPLPLPPLRPSDPHVPTAAVLCLCQPTACARISTRRGHGSAQAMFGRQRSEPEGVPLALPPGEVRVALDGAHLAGRRLALGRLSTGTVPLVPQGRMSSSSSDHQAKGSSRLTLPVFRLSTRRVTSRLSTEAP